MKLTLVLAVIVQTIIIGLLCRQTDTLRSQRDSTLVLAQQIQTSVDALQDMIKVAMKQRAECITAYERLLANIEQVKLHP